MAGISQYNIAFKGLAQGRHEFDFQINKRFFDYFDGGIAEDGDIQATVVLEKQSSFMILKFHINGTVKIQCDRCLEMYDQPVESENKVFVKYGEDSYEEGDDVIWLDTNEYEVNVAQMIYDFIILAIPIRQVHPDDENGNSLCDPEMLEKLEDMSYDQDEAEQETDSRWDDLKKLLGNE